MNREDGLSIGFVAAIVALLAIAAVIALLSSGCAIGSQYTRTETTITYLGGGPAPPPRNFGLRPL